MLSAATLGRDWLHGLLLRGLLLRGLLLHGLLQDARSFNENHLSAAEMLKSTGNEVSSFSLARSAPTGRNPTTSSRWSSN